MSNRAESITESYLNELAAHASQETFHSHQAAVSAFRDWYCDGETVNQPLEEASVVQFLVNRIDSTEYARATVTGQAAALANFVAYAHQRNPRLVQKRIVAELERRREADGPSQKLELATSPEKVRTGACESLLSYLRQCRFGCRIHAYTELLYDTKSQPGPLLDADVQDVALTDCTVELPLPETHVISNAGIVTEWTASFSSDTAAVVQEYLDYERTEQEGADREPLFTTVFGRVHPSTIRRDIRQASLNAADRGFLEKSSRGQANTEESTTTADPPLTPSDLWKCAIEVDQA